MRIKWESIVIHLIMTKMILCVLKSSMQITNSGSNQLLQLIKPYHRGYQLMVLWYKSFLIDTEIINVEYMYNVEHMYYIKIIVNFQNIASDPLYSLHL